MLLALCGYYPELSELLVECDSHCQLYIITFGGKMCNSIRIHTKRFGTNAIDIAIIVGYKQIKRRNEMCTVRIVLKIKLKSCLLCSHINMCGFKTSMSALMCLYITLFELHFLIPIETCVLQRLDKIIDTSLQAKW